MLVRLATPELAMNRKRVKPLSRGPAKHEEEHDPVTPNHDRLRSSKPFPEIIFTPPTTERQASPERHTSSTPDTSSSSSSYSSSSADSTANKTSCSSDPHPFDDHCGINNRAKTIESAELEEFPPRFNHALHFETDAQRLRRRAGVFWRRVGWALRNDPRYFVRRAQTRLLGRSKRPARRITVVKKPFTGDDKNGRDGKVEEPPRTLYKVQKQVDRGSRKSSITAPLTEEDGLDWWMVGPNVADLLAVGITGSKMGKSVDRDSEDEFVVPKDVERKLSE